MQAPAGSLSEADWQAIRARAEDPRIAGAFVAAQRDDEAWAQAVRDPAAWLRTHGVDLPDTVLVDFFRDIEGKGFPVPEGGCVAVRRTHCRTYFVSKRNDKGVLSVSTETVCFGFEMRDICASAGPWGR